MKSKKISFAPVKMVGHLKKNDIYMKTPTTLPDVKTHEPPDISDGNLENQVLFCFYCVEMQSNKLIYTMDVFNDKVISAGYTLVG